MKKKFKMIPEGNMYRVKALRDFGNVKKGDKGGLIENEDNLSHEGECWVYNNAQVFGYAIVCGNAEIFGEAKVYSNAEIFDNAEVCSDADYIVFKNWWSCGRYFTWTRSNNMWRVGCFFGSGEELIKKAYSDSEEKGKEYERVVRYVESFTKKL